MRGLAPSVVSLSGSMFNKKKRSDAGGSLIFDLFLQDTQQSVTVVLFRDQHTLISSGAVDG